MLYFYNIFGGDSRGAVRDGPEVSGSSARIAKPVHEVFEAVADPRKLSHYFTTGGAKGRLETGATVTWDFHDFPGAFPVEVIEVVPDEGSCSNGRPAKASGEIGAKDRADYQTTVTMTFKPARRRAHAGRDRRGRLARQPKARSRPATAIARAGSQMLCALKVWLEHGINLREGMYK